LPGAQLTAQSVSMYLRCLRHLMAGTRKFQRQ
jgi:hypothetical protein